MKIKSASFVMGAVSVKTMPDEGIPEIAFVGRSNVGKSSLINKFLGRKNIARTSSTPGKTQEVNFFLINEVFYLVDLPGFGYARVAKRQRAEWKKLISGYIRHRQALRIVFHLIDSRHPLSDIDRDILRLIGEGDAVPVVLLTKGDKLSGNQRQKSINEIRRGIAEMSLEPPVILTSAKDGRGKEEILGWVSSLLV